MNAQTPARALPTLPRTRRGPRVDDRTTNALMVVLVGGVAMLAALPFLDLFGYV